MSKKTKEICTVVSQECIGTDIYSLWIQTEEIASEAVPGQFVSVYSKDQSKLLPRPISICVRSIENRAGYDLFTE